MYKICDFTYKSLKQETIRNLRGDPEVKGSNPIRDKFLLQPSYPSTLSE